MNRDIQHLFKLHKAMTFRKIHPQKYYLNFISKVLYYLGLGNLWYEDDQTTLPKKLLYKCWMITANVFNLICVLNEMLEIFKTDNFNFYLQVTISYVAIYCKMLILQVNRDRVRIFLKGMIENHRQTYKMFELDKASIKKAHRYCVPLFVGVYMTFVLNTTNAVLIHLASGAPIRTIPTLYPDPTNPDIISFVLNLIVEVHSWYYVSIMVFTDSMCLCCLIFTQFKLKVVQLYFLSLREKFLGSDGRKLQVVEEEHKRDFITGIKLHEDALWCARNIQRAFGKIYDVQVTLSISLLALCLISTITSERNITSLLFASVAFLSVLLLTGTYMTASGDITYEASLVPTSIFYSGWEMRGASPSLRTLAVVALQRAQATVHMRAFGVIELSYENFISVLRSSYSFFALMY